MVHKTSNTISTDVFIFSCEHIPVKLPYYTNFYELELVKELAKKLKKTNKYKQVNILIDSKLSNDNKTYAQIELI